MLDALLVSSSAVALAEMGDKTQLLALMLAARYRKPWPIGILLATVLNHALAASVGAWLTHHLGPDVLRWIVGGSFLAVAAWMLVPDKVDEDEVKLPSGLGVLAATCVAFFIAEMGDKTQIATVVLAARYPADFIQVVCGTTLGMMVANVPAVFVGDKLTARLPMDWIHRGSALLFAIMGVLTLILA